MVQMVQMALVICGLSIVFFAQLFVMVNLLRQIICDDVNVLIMLIKIVLSIIMHWAHIVLSVIKTLMLDKTQA